MLTHKLGKNVRNHIEQHNTNWNLQIELKHETIWTTIYMHMYIFNYYVISVFRLGR